MRTTVVSVRVPEELLKRAKEEKIQISVVFREALEREIKKRELQQIVRRMKEEKWENKRINVAKIIREDRDGGH